MLLSYSRDGTRPALETTNDRGRRCNLSPLERFYQRKVICVRSFQKVLFIIVILQWPCYTGLFETLTDTILQPSLHFTSLLLLRAELVLNN